VVVCHLTKMSLFIPTFQDIDAEDLAHNFLSQVFVKHGTLTDIKSPIGESTSSLAFGSRSASFRHQGQPLNRLSSRDRRTNRMGQPDLGTISSGVCQLQTDDWVNLLPLAQLHTTTLRTLQPWSPLSLPTRVHPKLEVLLYANWAKGRRLTQSSCL